MTIHYNNGCVEKPIENIIAIQVFGNSIPIIALSESGKEYQISLDDIETILDDSLCKRRKQN